MPEAANDGFYWVPSAEDPLRQGDLLLNVPATLLPNPPELIFRNSEGQHGRVALQQYERFPQWAASNELVVSAKWGALSMVVTPTCHVSEGEKDQDIVCVAPVEPVPIACTNEETVRNTLAGNPPLHLFHLPPTQLAGELLPFDAVVQLDRPASFLKHNLRLYRRLALFRDSRWALRKAMSRFWARASADDDLERDLEAKIKHNVPLESLE